MPSLPCASPAVEAAPKIGFVSLGCPKALTDSELILTRLAAEGYATSKTYDGADLVIVNTCGFIDAAVRESLDAIGDALHANGRVIVTGCLGAKGGGELVRAAHPKVLAFTELQKRLADPKTFGPDAWTQFVNGQSPLMQGLMGNYLEQSKTLFAEMQKKMAEQAETLMPGFPGFPGARK